MPLIFGILSSIATAARLPALAGLLGGLFAKVVAVFATRFSASAAIQLGDITAIVGLTLALLLVLKGIVLGISATLPPFYSQAMSLVIPTNLLPCMTAVISARIVRWVWVWQVYFIQSVASAR